MIDCAGSSSSRFSYFMLLLPEEDSHCLLHRFPMAVRYGVFVRRNLSYHLWYASWYIFFLLYLCVVGTMSCSRCHTFAYCIWIASLYLSRESLWYDTILSIFIPFVKYYYYAYYIYFVFTQRSNFILLLFFAVSKPPPVSLQIVFFPLLAFEVAILVDNFRWLLLSFACPWYLIWLSGYVCHRKVLCNGINTLF